MVPFLWHAVLNILLFFDESLERKGYRIIFLINLKYKKIGKYWICMIKIVFLFKIQTFNSTDTVLKNVDVWPSIKLVTFFESKLTFQIQHSIFRTKVRLSICMFLDLGQSHSRYKRLRFIVRWCTILLCCIVFFCPFYSMLI